MVDPLHQQIIESIFSDEKGAEEIEVKMTFGELMLFHVLLQDYAIELVGNDRFIPLMERNKARIDLVK